MLLLVAYREDGTSTHCRILIPSVARYDLSNGNPLSTIQ